MTARDAVDVAGEIERQLGHVQQVRAGELPQLREIDQPVDQVLEQRVGKPVAPCRDRGVRGEHAVFAHRGRVVDRFARPQFLSATAVAVEQVDCKKC
jgi:hypothetical protein